MIGQLFGGENGCPPVLKRYGRLTESYLAGGAGSKEYRLSDWLNPYGNGNVQWQINSVQSGQTTTFENKTITEYDRVVGKNVIIQNITINSGATLLLQATDKVTIGSNVTVKSGGTLIIDGNLEVHGNYVVESGTSFVVE